MLLLLITLLTSCTLTDSTAVVDSANVCELALTQVAPEAASPGETIQLVLSPLTTADDTLVTIGGARAQLVSFERAGCEACDACRETYLCAPCFEDCDVCDLGCDAECVERVEVIVPSLPPGPALIEVFNGEGASGRLTLSHRWCQMFGYARHRRHVNARHGRRGGHRRARHRRHPRPVRRPD